MPTPRPNGHYDVRPHATIKGLLSVVWIEPGASAAPVLNVGPERLPLVAKALNHYLAGHPALTVPGPAEPEGESA